MAVGNNGSRESFRLLAPSTTICTVWRVSGAKPRFVASAQAAADGDRLAAESELPCAGRGAKRGECELRKRLSTISSLAPRSGLAFPFQNDLGTQKPWGAFRGICAKTPLTPGLGKRVRPQQ